VSITAAVPQGFDHFNGFYSAASDYFTHNVGAGYDYHYDFKIDKSAAGVYTTHHVTTAVQAWIEAQIRHTATAKTFAYVAHEAVHGPLEVPFSYIEGPCQQQIPASHPSRQIYCGMVSHAASCCQPCLGLTIRPPGARGGRVAAQYFRDLQIAGDLGGYDCAISTS
jgi:hypothetical protein